MLTSWCLVICNRGPTMFWRNRLVFHNKARRFRRRRTLLRVWPWNEKNVNRTSFGNGSAPYQDDNLYARRFPSLSFPFCCFSSRYYVLVSIFTSQFFGIALLRLSVLDSLLCVSIFSVSLLYVLLICLNFWYRSFTSQFLVSHIYASICLSPSITSRFFGLTSSRLAHLSHFSAPSRLIFLVSLVHVSIVSVSLVYVSIFCLVPLLSVSSHFFGLANLFHS